LPPGTPYGLANLPYGVFSVNGENDGARVGVRIGDSVLDLVRALGDEVFGEPSLNAFMAQGRTRWTEARARITELLTAGQQDERHRGAAEATLRPLSAVRLHLPFAPGDYVDFFGNEYHAANAGRIFRPDGEPLTPNWKHMPIGYHGRSGTIVPSGTPVTRPRGQRRGADGPPFGPSRRGNRSRSARSWPSRSPRRSRRGWCRSTRWSTPGSARRGETRSRCRTWPMPARGAWTSRSRCD
jgi:fumarylacetoacetase